MNVGDFYIGRYEVTFEEFDAYCEAVNKPLKDDLDWGRSRQPVIHVSWYEACEFCNWKSREEGLEPCYTIKNRVKPVVTWNTGANGYRLPTEMEWEYIAKTGQDSAAHLYSGGNSINTVAWYLDNAGERTHRVGTRQDNALGVYDLSGNVNEWCWNWFDELYYQQQPEDHPNGPENGEYKTVRGGAWRNSSKYCRVTSREGYLPAYQVNHIGFRLARSL